MFYWNDYVPHNGHLPVSARASFGQVTDRKWWLRKCRGGRKSSGRGGMKVRGPQRKIFLTGILAHTMPALRFVCAAVKPSVWELIGAMYLWTLKTGTKRREKQENGSVQTENFPLHLIFAFSMQTLCSVEVKGRCHLLWPGPPKKISSSLTFVLFWTLGNWQKLSWWDTELCTDKS